MSAVLWSLETTLTAQGKEPQATYVLLKLNFSDLPVWMAKRMTTWEGIYIRLYVKDKIDSRREHLDKAPGDMWWKYILSTQVITEVQVFRDVMQSLRSFKISVTVYRLKRRSVPGDLDVQNETNFTVRENRRNIDGPSKIWIYVGTGLKPYHVLCNSNWTRPRTLPLFFPMTLSGKPFEFDRQSTLQGCW